MESDSKTKTEVLREVRYRERLHFRHCRFYKRVRSAFTIINLAAGSAAIAAALQEVPGGVTAAAFGIAFITIIDAVGGFAEKAAKHNVLRRESALLTARSAPMDLATIEAALHQMQADVDDEIELLTKVSWNDVLDSVGYQHAMRPESVAERFIRVVA